MKDLTSITSISVLEYEQKKGEKLIYRGGPRHRFRRCGNYCSGCNGLGYTWTPRSGVVVCPVCKGEHQ